MTYCVNLREKLENPTTPLLLMRQLTWPPKSRCHYVFALLTRSLMLKKTVSFYETSLPISEVLVRVIKDVLLRLDIKLNRCREQTCDGAASMSGVNTEVAARIAAEEKRELNTTCLAHSLNLAVQDATKSNSLIGDVLVAIQELNNLIRSSAKRLGIFEKIQEELSPEAPSSKLLCPTRWTVRYVTLLAVQANFEPILGALEEISHKGTSAESTAKCRGLLRNVSRFEFLLGLKAAVYLQGNNSY